MSAPYNYKLLLIDIALFIGVLTILIFVGILILHDEGEQIYIACCEQLGGKIEISAFDCRSIPSDCAKCSIDDLTMCKINMINKIHG